MRYLKFLLGLLFFAPLASNAVPFEFSYTFYNATGMDHPNGPATITGSFDGVQDGLFVRNISNFRANLEGREFSQPLITERYSPETLEEIGNIWNPNIEGLFSFDVTLNNFGVVNADYYIDGTLTNYFYMFTNDGITTRAASDHFMYASDYGSPSNDSWLLRSVEVDEPRILFLFILALGALALRKIRCSITAPRLIEQ